MEKKELAKIAKRAKEVAIAISGRNEIFFENVQIDIKGNIIVLFTYYRYGDIEHETVCLSEEDLNTPIKETVAKHKKIAQAEADRRAKEKLKKERNDKIAKENEERTTYEKLKAKFEGE